MLSHWRNSYGNIFLTEFAPLCLPFSPVLPATARVVLGVFWS